jgi:fumarate hydratase subunit alpha
LELSPLLAKRALLRPIGQHSQLPHIADLETQLQNNINSLGIGPQGLGGRNTALAVNIETYPTHIASLPVAVNLNCHVSRHKTVLI